MIPYFASTASEYWAGLFILNFGGVAGTGTFNMTSRSHHLLKLNLVWHHINQPNL